MKCVVEINKIDMFKLSMQGAKDAQVRKRWNYSFTNRNQFNLISLNQNVASCIKVSNCMDLGISITALH